MYQAARHELHPALTLRLSEVNLSLQYARRKQANDILTYTCQGEQGRRIPKTPSLPQSSTLALGTLNGAKKGDQLCCTQKSERFHQNVSFELTEDDADYISDQLQRAALLVEKFNK